MKISLLCRMSPLVAKTGSLVLAMGVCLCVNAADVDPVKPILKIITPSGKIIYTDRELSDAPSGKVSTLRGAITTGQVLAEAPDYKSKDAVKTPASPTTGASAPASVSLVEWAKQQEAGTKQRDQKLKELQATAAKNACENAKTALATLEHGRVGKATVKGESEFLSDAQISDEKAKFSKQVAENCI